MTRPATYLTVRASVALCLAAVLRRLAMYPYRPTVRRGRA